MNFTKGSGWDVVECGTCTHKLAQLGLSAQDLRDTASHQQSTVEQGGTRETSPLLENLSAGGGGWGRVRLLLWYRANVHSSGKKAPATHTFM